MQADEEVEEVEEVMQAFTPIPQGMCRICDKPTPTTLETLCYWCEDRLELLRVERLADR